MGFRSAADVDEINPLLAWGQRFLVVILILLCGLTLLTDRLFPERTEPIRQQITDILTPMVSWAGGPVRWSKRRVHNIQAYIQTAELAAMTDQLALERDFLQQELDRREAQIEELRANINLPPEGLEAFLTARVLMTGNDLFGASLVLNVGAETRIEGVDIDSPEARLTVRPKLAVITRRGILGRLQSVGQNSSRVRLITSEGSALPVVIGDFRVRGTALGNNTNVLTITTEEALPGAIQIGDNVLTSSIDPDIPFLFHVGKIVATDPNIQLIPAAIDPDGIDGFVQVVLKEVLDQSGANP